MKANARNALYVLTLVEWELLNWKTLEIQQIAYYAGDALRLVLKKL